MPSAADVSRIAKLYGGGGHRAAAGMAVSGHRPACRLDKPRLGQDGRSLAPALHRVRGGLAWTVEHGTRGGGRLLGVLQAPVQNIEDMFVPEPGSSKL